MTCLRQEEKNSRILGSFSITRGLDIGKEPTPLSLNKPWVPEEFSGGVRIELTSRFYGGPKTVPRRMGISRI